MPHRTLVVLLLAFLPAILWGKEPKPQDPGTEVKILVEASASWIVPVQAGKEAVDWQGAVEQISPPKGDHSVSVGLKTAAGPAQSFRVLLPELIPLPFAVGDEIRVHIEKKPVGIHRAVNATVTDSQGNLLMAYSNENSAGVPPGWKIDRGPEMETAEVPDEAGSRVERKFVMNFSFGGMTTHVLSGCWKRIDVPGGAFFLGAEATTTEYRNMPRPPDSRSSFTSFTIVRDKTAK